MNNALKESNPMRTVVSRQGLLKQDELRIQYKNYYKQWGQLKKKLIDNGLDEYETYAHMPAYPREFHELRYGAKTRAGTPCKIQAIYSNSRCKLHGGLSTGAKTLEGKNMVAKNGSKTKSKKQTS